MRIIDNACNGLRAASANTSVPAWAGGTPIIKYELRRDTAESPEFIYRARSTIRSASNTTRPGITPALWQRIAPSANTWDITGAAVSDYPTWSSGGTIGAGEIVYDAWDLSDYEAISEITTNDTRPSVAVESADTAVARRWKRRGIANAHRMFDGQTATRTRGDHEANLVAGFTTNGNVDTVTLYALRGVASVKLDSLNSSGTQLATETKTLTYTGDAGSASTVTFTTGAYARFRVTLTRASGSSRVECGMISAGVAVSVGDADQEVRLIGENFSRTEENEWGNIDFLQRGYLTEAQARIYVDHARLDVVVGVLNRMQGKPASFDLNNSGIAFEHMRLWGWYPGFSAGYTTGTGKAEIALNIRALVEQA